MNNLFYSDTINMGDSPRLTPEDSRHCLKVLRRQPGDNIMVTDGAGKLYHCSLLDNNLSGCRLSVEKVEPGRDIRTCSLNLAVSLIKNSSRFEWFLEKATEIGVEVVTPLICERTEKQSFKSERYKKLLISAMKQSGRTILPELHEPVALDDFVSSGIAQQRFIAWCDENSENYLATLMKSDTGTVIMIGPEGDFTGEEVKHSLKNGFIPVTLGEARLRTETAAVFSCTVFNIINR